MRIVFHYCKRVLIFFTKILTCLIPKDNKLILFSSWNGEKYSDNPMYQFEYMREKGKYKVYWFTKNRRLYDSLIAKRIPVIYSKTPKGMWFQMRAKMLVSSVQLGDFNPYLLGRCIYLDLGHGFPIKQSGFEQPDCTERFRSYTLFLRWLVNYYMTVSSSWEKEIIERAFEIKEKNIIFVNSPRLDVLADKRMQLGKNRIVLDTSHNKKRIVYMPTQRSYGKKKMNMHEILDLERIQMLCVKYDAVFYIKKHFFHRFEKEDLQDYPNIIDITGEEIDTQVLLCQADILISDYSAAYIDYLLLDKPIVFYGYDLKDFLLNERNLYSDFYSINAGYKITSKQELNSVLNKLCLKWIDNEHSEGRLQLRKKYFGEFTFGDARENVCKEIDSLMQQ